MLKWGITRLLALVFYLRNVFDTIFPREVKYMT